MPAPVRTLLASWLIMSLTSLGLGCEKHPEASDRPVAWVPEAWRQPVPPWGSPVRLQLPVDLGEIVLGASGGLGAFGAHQGGHVEGLNHVWIPTVPGTPVRSWAAGHVTRIEDMGARGPTTTVHEYFVTVDYGQGLVGKHMDMDLPLVKVGDTVRAGEVIGQAPSAEFMLIDNRRSDGERTGGETGSPVSPFDYLADDVADGLLARHQAEVVAPFFQHGKVAGYHRPWEPYLTNPMLTHHDHPGTVVGEWILVNKGWKIPDPEYFDVVTIFDTHNAYGDFQVAELMDHDWGLPGNKKLVSATWRMDDGPGKVSLTLDGGAIWFARFSVEESGGRAHLTMEWQRGDYPEAITPSAAVYVERAPIYLGGDAQALGLLD